jgi:hypothetical protein
MSTRLAFRLLGLMSIAVLCAVAPTRAVAAPGLIVGVTDNAFRWQSLVATATARDLGVTAFRVSLEWSPGQTDLTTDDAANLDAMVGAAAGLRIVVTVTGAPQSAPLTGPARDAYCGYVRSVLTRYPTVNDVVIWNEPNLGFFWQPQFSAGGASLAPAAYEALLARCWDVLHGYRAGVNQILTVSPSGNDDPSALSNVSHSPGAFLRELGRAYRASGRSAPIFDTVGHNPYGLSSAEAPWARHLGPSHIGEGDLDRLLLALREAFSGTGQPVPGACGSASSCPTIWYLEAGYQTVPDAAHRAGYTGRENDARPVPDAGRAADGGLPTQSEQLIAGIRLAYCQPYVGAFFNFLLWDEPDLTRWQSGVLWRDGSHKNSYVALQHVIDETRAGRTDCARLNAAAATPSRPAPDALLERLEWSPTTVFSSFNEIWSFAVAARSDARFAARIARLRHTRSGWATGKPVLRAAGKLRKSHPRVVEFARTRIPAGRYRVVLRVSRLGRPPLAVTRSSPVFVVR